MYVVGGVAMVTNPPRRYGGVLFDPRALFIVVGPRPALSTLDSTSSAGPWLCTGRAGVGGAGVSFYVTGE